MVFIQAILNGFTIWLIFHSIGHRMLINDIKQKMLALLKILNGVTSKNADKSGDIANGKY